MRLSFFLRLFRLALRLSFFLHFFLQLCQRLLLLFHGSVQIAFLKFLGGVLSRFACLGQADLVGLVGDLLLELGQVGLVRRLAVRRLTDFLYRLLRILCGSPGLLQGLGNLLGCIGRINFAALHCCLVGDLHARLLVQSLGKSFLGFLQLLGRVFGFFGGRG